MGNRAKKRAQGILQGWMIQSDRAIKAADEKPTPDTDSDITVYNGVVSETTISKRRSRSKAARLSRKKNRK